MPLISMLGSSDHQVITFLYGPILAGNLSTLLSKPIELAKRNGLWKSILALSDFVLLDAPVLNSSKSSITTFVDNRSNKQDLLAYEPQEKLCLPLVKPEPQCIQEDDADTALHVMLSKSGFGRGLECMCNPPGGDWSGMSIYSEKYEYRWLSLPRVSHGDGKRPDHITEYFDIDDKPLLLVTESKGNGSDLEPDVGNRLISYVQWLMDYVPSVERPRATSEWTVSKEKVSADGYMFVSAGAYIERENDNVDDIQAVSNCDLLLSVSPISTQNKWCVRIYAYTSLASMVAEHIAKMSDGALFDVYVEKNLVV